MWKWGLVATAALGVAAFLALGREMYLVPGEGTLIVADIGLRNTTDPSKAVAVLPASEPVPVVECRSLKEGQAYRVRTQGGIEGYVVTTANFRIETKSWRDSLGGNRVVCR